MAIVDHGGRFQSVRTHDEYVDILLHSVEALPPEERQVAFEVLSDYLSQPTSPAVEAASRSVYRVVPCKTKEFLENPFYMGSFSRTIYPVLKQDLVEVFEGDYTHAIWGGSLGSGKTTALVVALIRMVYEASCLARPHEFYGVSSSDYLMFPGVSATEDIAERNILDKVRAIIGDSEYFQKHFPPQNDSVAKGILFGNRILIPPGASTSSQLIGGNICGIGIDESNFFQKRTHSSASPGDQKENVEMIYESLTRRMESRFKKIGRAPGIIVIASSKTTPNSFTERVINKSVDKPTVFVRERAVWEAQPNHYCGQTFQVAAGNETRNSFIVTDERPTDGMVVIDVPVEFREAFEDDIDQSIREFAGRSTISITPFIQKRDKIYECIDKDRSHPFSSEVWDQSVPGRVDWSKLAKLNSDGSWEPLHHPKSPRHIHLDLSKSQDKTGFTMSCISGYVPVNRLGANHTEMAPMVHVDFMLAIQAPVGGEIIYSEIRKLIYDFSAHGFYIKLTSADSYQSAALLQSLNQNGYKTKVLSVDISPNPYNTLKQAFYENRVSMYRYPVVIKELRELQKNWKTGKIDHPPQSNGGSKDCSDALAGAAFTLIESASVVIDDPVVRVTPDVVFQDEDQWILGEMLAVKGSLESAAMPAWRQSAEEALAGQTTEAAPEWRQNAEKALEQETGSQYDWQKSFQMPFVTG